MISAMNARMSLGGSGARSSVIRLPGGTPLSRIRVAEKLDVL
jgi:hypothetical protein